MPYLGEGFDDASLDTLCLDGDAEGWQGVSLRRKNATPNVSITSAKYLGRLSNQGWTRQRECLCDAPKGPICKTFGGK